MSRAALRVLYTGGTGTISAACVRASVARGDEVHVLNRGSSGLRPLPPQVQHHTADVRDPAAVAAALGGRRFDAVVDFLCYTEADALEAVHTYRARTGQYVYVSSASVYRKPVSRVPHTEATPLANPLLAYARDKIAAEAAFTTAWREHGFPVTVVRPSHTYDDARPPFPGDWTLAARLSSEQEVVVSGDGTSPWTLTHADDFAVGLVGLLGRPDAMGEAFHITSDEALPWDAIYGTFAAASGVSPRLLHLPADLIALAAPDWRWSELIRGDLSHAGLFDTRRIRAFVPAFRPTVAWSEGARRLVAWRADHPDATRPDPVVDAVLARLVAAHHRAERAVREFAP